MIATDVVVTIGALPYRLWFTAVVWCLVAQFFFWALYSSVQWKKHFVGRALFGQTSAVLFMLIVTVCARIFDFPGEDWVRAGSYQLLALALTNQAYAMWKQQYEEKSFLDPFRSDDDDTPAAP